MKDENKRYSINESGAGGQSADMDNIQRELGEDLSVRGAYCQSYDEFRNIFGFVKRGLKRSGRSVYTILITLTDREGNFIPLAEREEQMRILSDVIRYGLRMGDVFTRYSSCQFLLMVLDVSSHNAEKISARIAERFLAEEEVSEEVYVHCNVYPVEEI